MEPVKVKQQATAVRYLQSQTNDARIAFKTEGTTNTEIKTNFVHHTAELARKNFPGGLKRLSQTFAG